MNLDIASRNLGEIMDAKSFSACFDRSNTAILQHKHHPNLFDAMNPIRKCHHYCIYTIAILRRRKTAASFWECAMRVRACDIYFSLAIPLESAIVFNASKPKRQPQQQQQWRRICTSFISHIHIHIHKRQFFVLIQHRHSNETQSIIVVYLKRHRKNRMKYELFTICRRRLFCTHREKSVQFLFTYSPNASANIPSILVF